MIADAAFLSLMKERRIMIEPATGEDLDALAKETSRLPKPIVGLIAAMLK
mgnify:CR=1 FL=1